MKITITLFLLAVCALSANAQITLTSDDFIALYSQIGSASMTSYSLASPAGSGIGTTAKKTGAAVSWDFSGFTFNQETTASFTVLAYPGGAALASDADFTTATHVVKVAPKTSGGATLYEFYRLDANGLFNLGSTTDSAGGMKLFTYNPALQEYKFPLTFGTTWTGTANWMQTIFPGVTIVDSIVVTVDGYGSLTTPTGAYRKNENSPMASTNDALRITTKKTHAFIGVPVPATVTYQYEWVTKSNHRVTMSADKDQKITSASYSAGTSSGVDDALTAEQDLHPHFSANPASGSSTDLLFHLKQTSAIHIRIMDALGREMFAMQKASVQEGAGSIALDLSKLSAGSYFVYFEAEGMTTISKLIVAK